MKIFFAKSIFIKYLIGYILVVLCLYGMFIPVYNITINELENNALKENTIILNDKVTILDSTIQYLNSITLALRNNESFVMLVNVQMNDSKPSNYYYMHINQKIMKNIFITPDIIDNAFFLYKDSNILISRTRISDKFQEFYGTFIEFGDLSIEEFFEDIYNQTKPIFFPKMIYEYGDSTDFRSTMEVILYVVPTKNIDKEKYDSFLISLIDVEKMVVLLDIEPEKYDYYNIQDEFGNIIYEYNKVNENLGNSIHITSKMAGSGLQIYAGISSEYLKGNIENSYNQLRLFYIAALFIGLLLSGILSYRNSKPILKIKDTLNLLSKKNTDDTNIYSDIDDVLKDLFRLRDTYKYQVENLEENLRINLIGKLLLKEDLSNDEIERINREFEFLKSTYVVTVILFDNKQFKEKKPPNIPYKLTITVAISEIIQKSIPNFKFSYNMLHEKSVGFIAIDESIKDYIAVLEKKFIEVQNSISEELSFDIGISMSNLHRGYSEISNAYNEAWSMLRIRDNSNFRDISFFEKIELKQPATIFTQAHKLNEIIRAGSDDEAILLIDDIYTQCVKHDYINDDLLFDAYNSVYTVLASIQTDISERTKHQFSAIRYSKEYTIHSMLKILRNRIILLCQYINDNSTDKSMQIIEKMDEYIRDNFGNANLSVYMIAEHCGVTEKYLYACVKEHSYKSVGEKLEEIRMEHAIDLLKNSHEYVNDISSLSGFNSTNTFYKAFKRYTGISPSVYREKNL